MPVFTGTWHYTAWRAAHRAGLQFQGLGSHLKWLGSFSKLEAGAPRAVTVLLIGSRTTSSAAGPATNRFAAHRIGTVTASVSARARALSVLPVP